MPASLAQTPQYKVQDEQGAFSFNHLIISGLIEMRAAKAAGEKQKYYSFFMDILQTLAPFIPEISRMKIQKDWEVMEAYDADLDSKVEKGELHVDSAEKLKLKGHLKFAKEKMIYITQAIPNAGIYRKEEEGIITFDGENAMPYEAQTRIIRTTQGIQGQTKKALDDHATESSTRTEV